MAISNTGSKIRFVKVATNNVIEVSHPKDCVPPKPLKQKMIKPAISTIDVYKILNPVCFMVSDTVFLTSKLFAGSSCL